MAARRADKALAGATAAAAPIGGQQPTTRPATGNILNQRQNLFKQMETSGAGGITPAMRSQARSLGVADNDFNTAADRVRTNQNYTPGAAAIPGAGATAATSAQPQKQPRRYSPPAPNPAMEKLYGPPSQADPQKLGKMYANRPAPAAPAAPAAPMQGRALAQKNIAEKGIIEAAADYFQHRDTEIRATQAKQREHQVSTQSAKLEKDYNQAKSKDTSPSKVQRGSSVAVYRQPDKPLGSLGVSAPTRPSMEAPLAKPVETDFSDNNYGGNVVMNTPPKPPAKSMGYNKAAVDKVKGATNKIDTAMNTGVQNIVASAKSNAQQRTPINQDAKEAEARVKKLVSDVKALPDEARSLSDRTNAWAAEVRKKNQAPSKPVAKKPVDPELEAAYQIGQQGMKQTASNTKSRFRSAR